MESEITKEIVNEDGYTYFPWISGHDAANKLYTIAIKSTFLVRQ